METTKTRMTKSEAERLGARVSRAVDYNCLTLFRFVVFLAALKYLGVFG